MKKVKKAYYYLFYKLYKFWETAPARFWSDWKAGVSIIALELWFFSSLINYYRVYIEKEFYFSKNFYLAMAIFFASLNYFLFIHTDKWKNTMRSLTSYRDIKIL